MRIIDFKRLDSLESISQNFGIHASYIEAVICSPDKYYHELRIPKKGRSKGKHRIVYKADEMLASLQSEIQTHIEYYIYNKENIINDKFITKYAYGFIRKKGTLKNAKIHLNKKNLLNIDIKDFFKSITTNDVYHVFLKLGTPRDGAKILSEVCTYNNKLEEGLHTSPIISNLHCYELDHDFAKLGKSWSSSYTRYADDITFSSNSRTPNLKSIEKILRKHNFNLNKDKTRCSKQGKAQYVTGLSISNDQYPRIPRPIKRRLRMELYYIKKHGFYSHLYHNGIDEDDIYKEKRRIEGWLEYISGIEPDFSNKYGSIFDECED